jgi:hypothetical protein
MNFVLIIGEVAADRSRSSPSCLERWHVDVNEPVSILYLLQRCSLRYDF